MASSEPWIVKIDHELKTDPEPFAAVWEGRKTFELRPADRPFKDWDAVLLREHIRGKDGAAHRYTGREVLVESTYLLHAPQYGLPEGMCLFAFRWISSRKNG